MVCMALPMFAEADAASNDAPLAKRAEVAMLSLQLRAAEREADEAESALETQWSGGETSNVIDLLDPLLARRRQELEAEFNAARQQAALEIAQAHQQVAEWLTPVQVAAVEVAEPAVATSEAGFDAEGFARAFAQSFGKVLEERAPMWTAAPAQRPRFWAHAKHIDVLLIVAATAIVGVVLAAWMV